MIQCIRFYTIQWSHYCDKIRWALDLKEISYELINYNRFGKTKGLERAHKTMPKLMPMIEDLNNKDDNQFHYDSTPILLYLDTQYPQSSISLFPSSNEECQQVIDTCLRLDSTLSLYGRRIAYVQILTESPNVLSLVLREKYPWAHNPDDIRSRLFIPFIVAFIIARYQVHRIREEQILLDIGNHVHTNDYLVGNQFSAADLTFCSLVKLLIRVPYFYDDHRFQIIFDYYERIRRNYDPAYPNIDNDLEKNIDKHRIQVLKKWKKFNYSS